MFQVKALALFCLITGTLGQTYPEANATTAGNSVTFKCRPAPGSDFTYVSWVELITDPDNAQTIWHTSGSISNPGKYSVDTGDTKYDLTVKNVQINNAGEYQCRPITSGGPQGDKKAQLTVVGNPICPNSNGQLSADIETPANSDMAALECRIDFRGNNAVQLAWHYPDGVMLDSTSTTGPANLLVQNTTFRVKASDDQAQFQCRVTVQNVESYESTCLTQPLFNVRYPVLSIVSFQPAISVFEVGQQINCSGNGNPEPTYNWEKVAGPCNSDECSFIDGQFLTISNDMIGQNTYRCYARNTVKGTEHTSLGEKQFEVRAGGNTAASTGGPNIGAIVGGVIGGLIGLVIIIVLVYFLVIKRSRDKSGTPDKTEPEGHEVVPPSTEVEGQLPPDYIYSQPIKDRNPDKERPNDEFTDIPDMDDNENAPKVPPKEFEENGHQGRYANVPPGGYSYGVNPADVHLKSNNDTAV